MSRLCTFALALSILTVSASASAQAPPPPKPVTMVVVNQDSLDRRLDAMLERVIAANALAESKPSKDAFLRLRKLTKELKRDVKWLRRHVGEAPLAGAMAVTAPGVAMHVAPGHTAIGAPGTTVVVEAPGVAVVETTEPAPVIVEEDMGPEPMPPAEFERALSAIAKESFSDGKLEVLKELVTHNFFLVSQVGRVLSKFSFGEDKLKALRLLAPQIVDPENNYQIYSQFTFDDDKKAARRILAQ